MALPQNILIVYFSRTGNTRLAAEELARQLHCDIQEIQSLAKYPAGFIGYQRALFHAAFGRSFPIRIEQRNLAKYDLVIVGSPVWGSSIASPVRTFLETYRGQIKNLSVILTQGGTHGRQRVLKQVKELFGRTPFSLLAISSRDISQRTYIQKIEEFAEKIRHLPLAQTASQRGASPETSKEIHP